MIFVSRGPGGSRRSSLRLHLLEVLLYHPYLVFAPLIGRTQSLEQLLLSGHHPLRVFKLAFALLSGRHPQRVFKLACALLLAFALLLTLSLLTKLLSEPLLGLVAAALDELDIAKVLMEGDTLLPCKDASDELAAPERQRGQPARALHVGSKDTGMNDDPRQREVVVKTHRHDCHEMNSPSHKHRHVGLRRQGFRHRDHHRAG
mmetsp:Transcript_8192/g.18311  ORF Transcript_8192/g.18311 Transcript_8192/m.18311 type:complete len:203 (-) Transcript_8192:114-722(-)